MQVVRLKWTARKVLLSLFACAKVETDAFDRTILAVLVQEGRPVAFESWKLNETEQRFTVHEKEMTAVVHCLRLWRHYLLGGKFEIQTDNVAMSYFDTQKKLRPKQARWQVGRV